MDNKVIGGALTALGVLGALVGVYIFSIAVHPVHTKRLAAALVLGLVFIAVGIFMTMRPSKAAA